MPKCSMAPPILGDRRRNHVAPVGDRGSAEHDHQFRAETEQFLDRRRQRGLVMRHAALGDDGGARGRQPLRRHPQGFSTTFGASPGSKVETMPTRLMM